MKRLLTASFACVFLAACSAIAADPPGPGKRFDCSNGGTTSCASDDTGCVPGSKDNPGAANVAATLKCADAIAKAFAKAIGSVIKCHKKQADQAFKNAPMDDESCETGPAGGKSAKEKLDAAIAKVASLCTATELASAGAEETTLFAGQSNPLSLDAQNGSVYCDSTTGVLIDPSGDDAGFVPADGNQLKCADAVGKELAKLAAAAIKCHVKMADAFFNGKDFDENICEENDPAKHKSALEKYNAAMTKLTAKNICTQPCLSAGNRTTLGANILAQVEAANVVIYPCPTTTSTTTTTSTSTTTSTCPTPVNACTCTGGTPLQYKFQTILGAGNCGHLDADFNPNFFPLTCGGLYFGGGSVAVPQPAAVPDNFFSVIHACCDGSTLTLSGTASAETGGNVCSGGSNHNNPCISSFDCPNVCIGGPNNGSACVVANCPGGTCSGGTCSAGTNVGKACCGAPGACNFGSCKFQNCTTAGCLFGPPLPIPNSSHGGAPSSTCGILTITATASGTADCSTGEAHNVNLPLNDLLYLVGDLMPNRCVGGSTPGAPCGSICGSSGTCPGGTCTNDTGRCTDTGGACCGDGDCGAGTCETGACVGGANIGKGCITDADCPGSTCKTFIQVCPVCNPGTNTCNGGPNNGLACTPQSLNPNGDYPTSHECPPPSSLAIGSLGIAFLLDTGTLTNTAIDVPGGPGVGQANVFCGYCKNGTTNQFARKCGGVSSGSDCTCTVGTACTPSCAPGPGTTTGACLPVTCNPANGNTDCTAAIGHQQCGQRTSGAFTNTAVARTIVETGASATGVTVGGAPVASTLVSIFCIPPSYNLLVDSAGDLPGPGAVALFGNAQLLP